MTLQKFKDFADSRNLLFFAACFVAASLLWNTAEAVIYNYQLQQRADVIREDIALLDLQNEQLSLDLSYYNSDDYFERVIRRNLALRAEGEQLIKVAANADQPQYAEGAATDDNSPQVVKNIRAWREFLFGSG